MLAEQHANARFARQLTDTISPHLLAYPIYVAYNIAYWLPLALALTGTLDNSVAFNACAVIIAVRATLHAYRNNALTAEQAMRFPFRAP